MLLNAWSYFSHVATFLSEGDDDGAYCNLYSNSLLEFFVQISLKADLLIAMCNFDATGVQILPNTMGSRAIVYMNELCRSNPTAICLLAAHYTQCTAEHFANKIHLKPETLSTKKTSHTHSVSDLSTAVKRDVRSALHICYLQKWTHARLFLIDFINI